MTKTKIEWATDSWNPLRARNLATGKIGWHCEHVTTGCEHCYAEGINKRLGTGLPFKPGHRADIEILLDEKMLLAPLSWKRPRRIFVGSMTDLFADFVTDEMLDKIFAVMACSGDHTFQVLTKRADRMRRYVAGLTRERIRVAAYAPIHRCVQFEGRWLFDFPLPNVWLGISCERQEEADERIPLLLQTPAAVRFISAEPLLGPIDLEHIVAPEKVEGEDWRFSALCNGDMYSQRIERTLDPPLWDVGDGPYREHALDWVIVGGESGPHARPMHPDWARSLRDQCQAAVVAFFFKQWGEFYPDDDAPDAHMAMNRVGKKAAGRLLDGREWNEFPKIMGR